MAAGASSVTTALSAAGMSATWSIAGFLPSKAGERDRWWRCCKLRRAVTLAPHRIDGAGGAMHSARRTAADGGRELTKQFEESQSALMVLRPGGGAGPQRTASAVNLRW
jgi:16S rRNA C1402 (ribose-2'-O) methylase RsmI